MSRIFRNAARESSRHALAQSTARRFPAAARRLPLVLDDNQREAITAMTAPTPHGYYLWGGVGRGKSLLAELYLDQMPAEITERFHFHDFFRRLHAEITTTRLPLDEAIARMLGPARAVLFDEFHVHDVADAVLLTATLRALFHRDILLVATSNYPPEGLLPDPLQHERFLPAITLIRDELRVVAVGDGTDYRVTSHDHGHADGFGAGSWFASADGSTSPVEVRRGDVTLMPNGIPVHAQAADAEGATFAYAELFDRPLGVREYLWIADHFPAVTLTAVPDLAHGDRDALVRFSILVDVLYDRDIPLTVCADSDPDAMLAAPEPPRDAARTVSRLATLRSLSRATAGDPLPTTPAWGERKAPASPPSSRAS